MNPSHRAAVLRWADGLVLLGLLYRAAGAIVRGEFGADATGQPQLHWYLLAMLYAGACWLAGQDGAPLGLRRLAALSLLLCAHACLQRVDAPAASGLPGWPDWLGLGLGCLVSAALRWPRAGAVCGASSPSSSSSP